MIYLWKSIQGQKRLPKFYVYSHWQTINCIYLGGGWSNLKVHGPSGQEEGAGDQVLKSEVSETPPHILTLVSMWG